MDQTFKRFYFIVKRITAAKLQATVLLHWISLRSYRYDVSYRIVCMTKNQKTIFTMLFWTHADCLVWALICISNSYTSPNDKQNNSQQSKTRKVDRKKIRTHNSWVNTIQMTRSHHLRRINSQISRLFAETKFACLKEFWNVFFFITFIWFAK